MREDEAGGEEGETDAKEEVESYEMTESNEDEEEFETLRSEEVGEEKEEG